MKKIKKELFSFFHSLRSAVSRGLSAAVKAIIKKMEQKKRQNKMISPQEKRQRIVLRRKIALIFISVILLIAVVVLIVKNTAVNNVENLTIYSTDSSQTLEWTGVRKGLSYEVYCSAGNEDYELIDTLTDGETVRTYSNLTSGLLYKYKIVTVKSDYKTDGACAQAYTRPNTAIGVSAETYSDHSLTVTWKLQGAADSFELKYGIYENLRDGKIITIPAADVQGLSDYYNYTLNDLVADETYYISIKTISGEYQSDWSSVFSGSLAASADLSNIDLEKPMIALTFDGGPDGNGYTERILDTLSQYNASATFFQTGENAELYPELLNRIVEEGHELGNHTYDESHVGYEVTESDILDANTAMEKICGISPKLFRAPQGNVTDDIINICETNGMAIILWDIDSQDWATYDSQDIIDRVESYAENGDIIQFRNIYEETADAIDEIVPYLVENGYQLVTVSQLIQASTDSIPEAGSIYYSAFQYE